MATRRVKRKAAKKNPRIAILRNTEGYMAGGKFHPIRGGDDYDPDMVGERGKDEFGYSRKKKSVKRKAAKKNPAFPIGKFVPVDKVRVNRNGTIDIMRSKSKRPKR